MPIHILGISAFYHDSAAALVRDGDDCCSAGRAVHKFVEAAILTLDLRLRVGNSE